MRALFLQHDPGSQPGLIGASLRRRGIEVVELPMAGSIADGTWTGALPTADEFDLLVPLGAIFSLNDETQVGTWLERELGLLRDADRLGVPVLGICFGGQALAVAHGGEVRRSPRPQIGWSEVDTDRPELVPPGPWMQWHSDRFVVPPDATEVARDALCPQAFVLRRNLAVQFHPEVDETAIAHWLALSGGAGEAAAREAGTSADAVLLDAREQVARAADDVDLLVDAFLGDVAGLH